MNKGIIAGCFLFVLFIILLMVSPYIPFSSRESINGQVPPDDWFFAQRAFPYQTINYDAWNQALKNGEDLRLKQPKSTQNLVWQQKGPENIGGRISDVELDPSNVHTIYFGAASGGVFKSVNDGVSWLPVFDNALSLSIGDIAIAPSDPDVLYVGTGESNGGGGSVTYDGVGIYKSTDAGTSWTYSGLPESGSIGRIAVDPQNPQVVYVAAMGRLFSNNSERGVYKSIDGGQNWQKVLFLNDSTGAIDVMIDPLHPDTVYAAMWERVRRPGKRIYGGSACGIYRSFNGGQTWTHLTNGLQQGPDNGRIGISLCAAHPNVLYAIYADATGYFSSVYKSSDYGNSWIQTNDAALANAYASYGWWFGRIQADPVDQNIAYVIGFNLYKTSDGGNFWSIIGSNVHVDQHALAIWPQNHDVLYLGNDGGLYSSTNQGVSWSYFNNIPITQFYTCEIDNMVPQRLYGGTQDNGTIRTYTGSVNNWADIYGGDGFRVLVDPTDNNYVYAEYQYGGISRSLDGGTSWWDATAGLSFSDRFNWNTPYIIDPNTSSTLYLGSNRVYKSVDHAETWTPISADLSNGYAGNGVVYGTISTLSVSPVDPNIILAGTDDGNVWITQSNGANWTKVSSSLPLRYITSVANDPFLAGKAFVSLSGFRYDEYLPHVFMTTDFGLTWQSISGNLPDIPVNEILPHPQVQNCYFAATDIGVLLTLDGGVSWNMLGTELPNVPVTDIKYHLGTHSLIAATYGRSMYMLNVESINAILQQNPVQNTNIYYSQFSQSIIVEGLTENNCNYSIYSVDGRLVADGKINKNNQIISVQNLNSGVYLISINNLIRKGSFTKFIKP